MKLLRNLFILVAMACGAYWLWHRAPAPASPEAESERAAAPSATPQSLAGAPTRTSGAPAPEAGARPLRRLRERGKTAGGQAPEPLEENTVEFTLRGGYAVAYGDVVLGKPDASFSGRTGVTEVTAPELWKNGTVPYSIAGNVSDPSRIEKAVEYLNRMTAAKFVPYQGEADGVVFQGGDKHCYSYLGKIGGIQPIFLSSECGWTEILHEMLHALGFVHEQSRPDRDQYIEILWENIDEEYRAQFDKAPDAWTEAVRGSGFDFLSLMLYRPDAFAKGPGLLTMKSKSGTPIAPVASGLSAEDVRRINRLYGLHE